MRSSFSLPLASLGLGLLRNSFVNGAGVLLLAAAALLRDTSILRTFGLGAQTDAFFLALLIPTMLGSVLSSTFSSSLVPAYHNGAGTGDDGNRTVCLLSAVNLMICTAAALVLALAAPLVAHLIGQHYPPAIRAGMLNLLWTFVPVLAFAPMASTWAAALQAQQRFFAAAIAPVAAPLVCAGAILFAGRDIGVEGAGIALVLGVILQALLLAAAARKSGVALPPLIGFAAVARQLRASRAAMTALRQYWPLIIGSLLQSGLVVIPQLAAAWLAPGAVTALSLGARMTTLGMAIIGAGIGVTALPVLSQLGARQEWPEFTNRLRFYSLAAIAVATPAALGLFVLSEPIAQLLYGHGATTHDEILRIAQVQALFGLQLPVQILGIVWVRALSAMNENRRLIQIAAVNLVLSLGVTLGLARLMGVAGVALAPTIIFCGSCVQIGLIVRACLAARTSTGRLIETAPEPAAG